MSAGEICTAWNNVDVVFGAWGAQAAAAARMLAVDEEGRPRAMARANLSDRGDYVWYTECDLFDTELYIHNKKHDLWLSYDEEGNVLLLPNKTNNSGWTVLADSLDLVEIEPSLTIDACVSLFLTLFADGNVSLAPRTDHNNVSATTILKMTVV